MQGALFASHGNIVQDDAFAYLSRLPSESVDLIITDPPYESLEKHKATGTTTRLNSFWFLVMENKLFYPLFEHFYSILKRDRHCYMFCDDETSDYTIPAAKEAGFTYWKRIVWDKMRMGTGYHYRNRHEFILFFEKGHRNLNRKDIPSVLQFPRIQRKHDHPDYYPTEKPVELLELLVEMSSRPGELVLDPFAGSGSTLVAAKKMGRNYWGCDIQEQSIKLAKRRLDLT